MEGFVIVFGDDFVNFIDFFEYVNDIYNIVFFDFLKVLDVIEVEVDLWYVGLIFGFFNDGVMFEGKFVVVW